MNRSIYPGYKDSGLAWLGRIPNHWNICRLKHIARIIPSNVDKHSKEDELSIRLCNYTDVYYRDKIVEDIDFMHASASSVEIERFELNGGDVVITKDSETADDIGVPSYVPRDLPGVICGYHLAIIRVSNEEEGRYLKYLFMSDPVRYYFEISARGLTRVGLSQGAIGTTPIPEPPRTEKEVIADFLDHETARLDALIEEQRRLIELLKEERQSIVSLAVTKGINSDSSLKDSGQNWLDSIPAHWSIVPIRSLASPKNDAFVDGDWIEAPYITDDGVRLIQTGNIGIGRFREQGYRYISEETFEQLQCTEVNPGDVLVCRLAEPVGRACLAPPLDGRMITSVDVCILKTARHVDAEFLVYSMSSKLYLDFMHSVSRGGTRQRVSRKFLGNVRIPLPTIDEQQRIADYLKRTLHKSDALLNQAKELIELLKERRSALISAAVTGKIDVRESDQSAPAEEPVPPQVAEKEGQYG